jgi:1-acyl-sn-glycerol-3-phosphate acyltransferase
MIHAIRSAISFIVRALFAILTKTKVSGIENVPEDGGCILAMNHLSRLDPALVYIQLKRQNMTALVADKYKNYPGLNWIVNLFGGIWINREDADYQAMREARQFMNNGGLLGIAPEGTRSNTKALIQAKTGTAFLADKVCVPLVPIAVTGTENAIHLWFRLRRPNLTLQFGEPFTLPPLDRNDRSGSLRKNTDELMCRIAAMLPEEYRGVYADHPRLQELLAEGNS